MITVRRASDLKFYNVGRKLQHKSSLFCDNKLKVDAKQSLFQSQMYPNEQKINNIEINEDEQQKIQSIIEDPRMSRLTHGKILLIQKLLFVITILIFFCAIIRVQIQSKENNRKDISTIIMLIMDITTFIMVFFIVIRKILVFELQIDQKKVYKKRKSNIKSKNHIFLMLANYQYLKELIIQVLIVLPHPSIVFQNQIVQFQDQYYYKMPIKYSLNDLLGILLILKIYIILRSIVALTMFSTPRASRICNYSGINHNFFFIIKCLQQQYPLRCSGLIFFLSLIIFGYAFRITQGRLRQYNNLPFNRFQDLLNCIWFTFITITNVGYGDIVVTITSAKIIAAILSIIGVVINSQLIMALAQYLKMQSSQILSQTALQRLNQQKLLQKSASNIVCQSIRIAKVMNSNSLDPLVTRKLKPYFVQLKNQIDYAKAQYKRKKTILPSQNITQQMIRSFQYLKDNFKQIYNWQHKLKHKIQALQEQQGLDQNRFKNSFRTQVNNLLRTVR